MKLSLFSDRGYIGYATVWALEKVKDHTLIVSPRIRLSQPSAVGMMEHGESLLSTFAGVRVLIGQDECQVSTIAGDFLLPKTGNPDIQYWVATLPGTAEVRISDLLSRGLRLARSLEQDR
jgi:hypothetical protein